MRTTLAASALMLALTAPAGGANRQSWDFVAAGKETVQLVYGVPDSEAVTISFWCEAKPKRIEIVTTLLPPRPRKGQAVKTPLSNGIVTAAYDGKIGHDAAHESFHFAASTAAEPKVLSILKSGTSLAIAIPGKQVRVPLRGGRQAPGAVRGRLLRPGLSARWLLCRSSVAACSPRTSTTFTAAHRSRIPQRDPYRVHPVAKHFAQQ